MLCRMLDVSTACSVDPFGRKTYPSVRLAAQAWPTALRRGLTQFVCARHLVLLSQSEWYA